MFNIPHFNLLVCHMHVCIHGSSQLTKHTVGDKHPPTLGRHRSIIRPLESAMLTTKRGYCYYGAPRYLQGDFHHFVSISTCAPRNSLPSSLQPSSYDLALFMKQVSCYMLYYNNALGFWPLCILGLWTCSQQL